MQNAPHVKVNLLLAVPVVQSLKVDWDGRELREVVYHLSVLSYTADQCGAADCCY